MSLRRWPLLLCLVLLAGCGKTTTDLVQQLKAPASTERLHAVNLLAQRTREAETVVPALIDALQDEDVYVRRDAARALGQFGPEATAAVPALRLALHDREPSVRKAAADSLLKIETKAMLSFQGVAGSQSELIRG